MVLVHCICHINLKLRIQNLESRISLLECGTQSKSLGIRMYNSPPYFRVVSKIFVLHKVSARWCLYTVCICHTSEVGNTGKDGHLFHFVCLITTSAIFSSVMLKYREGWAIDILEAEKVRC